MKKNKIEFSSWKTAAILRVNKKNFQDEELPHDFFVTTRQITKTKNVFANNMSTDIKHSKAQISKITDSGGFLRNMLGNLGKKNNNRSCNYFS